jgi:hypothetical protein
LKRQAFTIAEVLIASFVGLLLMTVALFLFNQVGGASYLGSSQLELQMHTREILRRLGPTVRMATAPNSAMTGIYAPDIGATASNVVFCCPEDLLSQTPAAFNPRTPVYYLLHLRYDTPSRQLILEDFYSPTPTRQQILGRDTQLFQATRTHRIGLRLEVECQKQMRDISGRPKTIKFNLADSIQIPE